MKRPLLERIDAFLAPYKYSNLCEKFHSGTLNFRIFGQAQLNNRYNSSLVLAVIVNWTSNFKNKADMCIDLP